MRAALGDVADLSGGMLAVVCTGQNAVTHDEKIAVFDSVDERFADEWIDNIDKVLGGKNPEYFVVQHMEPDHSGSIVKFMEKYAGKRIIIHLTSVNFANDEIAKLAAIHTQYPDYKFTVALPALNLQLVAKLKEKDIPFLEFIVVAIKSIGKSSG